MKVLIFGAGFSGRAIGAELAGKGAAVAGTTRSPERFPALRQAGIRPLLFDGRELGTELAAELRTATHLVVSAAPDAAGDPVLNAAGALLREEAPDLRWIGYLSTVGVYGNRDGGWVDETGALAATSQRGRQRIAAEQAWAELGAMRSVPAALLRLAGIYGPGRNALLNLETGKARRVIKPGQVFNRIHVEDIAGATAFLAERELGGAFNFSDDEPSPPQDVVAYAARLLGIDPPPELPFEEADLSPMARSFYADNKRVANRRLNEAGYRFRFPTYREAFDAMHARGSWRSG